MLKFRSVHNRHETPGNCAGSISLPLKQQTQVWGGTNRNDNCTEEASKNDMASQNRFCLENGTSIPQAFLRKTPSRTWRWLLCSSL